MKTTSQKKLSCPSALCLNICSGCSLQCEWCYKQADISNSLEFEEFVEFYDKIINEKIQTVSLIGGEPTEHKDFFSFLRRANSKNIALNTNGIMFSDVGFLNECLNVVNYNEKKNLFLTISIKGYDEYSFYRVTHNKKFSLLCNAIRNIQEKQIHQTYTYIYDSEMNDKEMLKFIYFLKKFCISQIVISDLRPYITVGKNIVFPKFRNGLIKLTYQLVAFGIDVYIRLNHPLCEYNTEFIVWLIKEGRLITACAVKCKHGFFFSSKLDLIACNELEEYSLGRFGRDFNNYKELCEYWNSDFINNVYHRIMGYPMSKCITCNYWKICGGGCILNWRKEEL